MKDFSEPEVHIFKVVDEDMNSKTLLCGKCGRMIETFGNGKKNVLVKGDEYAFHRFGNLSVVVKQNERDDTDDLDVFDSFVDGLSFDQ